MAPQPTHEEATSGHAHEHAHEDRRIRVLHGASPFCHWSFGYEPVLERLRMVYGDQVKINVYHTPVYQSWEQWKQDYEMNDEQAREWMLEIEDAIGVPIELGFLDHPTKDCTPGTAVVHAAEIAKPGAGERLARDINFYLVMQGRPFDEIDEMLRMAEGHGAPRKAMEEALESGAAEQRMIEDRQSMHALGLNYYALQLRDFEGRTVILEHAFDPAKVEEALEWISRGTLRKRGLPNVADYVAEHAPVTRMELERVFRLEPAAAEDAAEPAVRDGRVVRRDLVGHPCWVPPK